MADAVVPQRGEVWLISFDPAIGGEMQKTRPAIVISNDTANALLNRVQVVPISSQVSRLYPAEAFISLNSKRRKAMADQVTTASNQRLVRRLGALAPEGLTAVIRATLSPPSRQLSAGVVKAHEPVPVRHSARNFPLNDPMKALSVGFPGREKVEDYSLVASPDIQGRAR